MVGIAVSGGWINSPLVVVLGKKERGKINEQNNNYNGQWRRIHN